MDRRRPGHALRMRPHDSGGIGVGNMERAGIPRRAALFVMRPVERKQHDFRAGRETIHQVLQARNETGIDLTGRVMHTAGVHVENLLDVLQRVPQAVHLRIGPGAAVAVSNPNQMRVHIPHLGRIDTCPDLPHQRMSGQFRRQSGATRVEHPGLRPQAPAGETETTDDAGALEELATVHADSTPVGCAVRTMPRASVRRAHPTN